MNSTSSPAKNWFASFLRLALLLLVATSISIRGGQAADPASRIPIIKMDDVPLLDAIKNLARQAQLNYVLDPRISSSASLNRSNVTMTLTDVTAEQALAVVLKDHHLKMVANPATSIARIVSADSPARPVPPSELTTDTSQIIPIIVMDEVPLFDAIKNLARQAQINLIIDPKLSESDAANPSGRVTISIRWENVTAKQALASILDNYELEIKKGSADGTFNVSARAQ